MLSILLFMVYGSLLLYAVQRWSFHRASGIPPRILMGLFIAKVLAGAFSTWMILRLPYEPDIVMFQREAMKEYELLFSHPLDYVRNFFSSGYAHGHAGFLQAGESYWNDITVNIIIKLLSVFNLFTGGDVYANGLFFNAVIFSGLLAWYRAFQRFLEVDGWPLWVGIFLVPGALVYSSAIHKEGLVMAGLGWGWYGLARWLEAQKIVFKYAALFVLAGLFLVLQRNYVGLAFWASAVVMVWGWYRPKQSIWMAMIMLVLGGCAFFGLPALSPSLDFPAWLAGKQAAFLGLPRGNTTIDLPVLDGSLASYIRVFPAACVNGWLRPYGADIVQSWMLAPFWLEWWVLWIGGLFALGWYIRKGAKPMLPYAAWMLVFSGIILLIIGYTIPVLGALVRYRVVVYPLFAIPLLVWLEDQFRSGAWRARIR